MNAPHELDASALSDALRAGELSRVELMRHTLERIGRLNGAINAVVSLRDEATLLAEARRADERFAADPGTSGWLHGVPFAIKDLVDTAGIRTTYGSPLFAEHVPGEDAMLARRLRAAGAIPIGKTNTPEFGLGSQTYNAVHGVTRNPYDLARTAGGSSGGAAAALAARLLPLADGSDMMGSLRNPAAFCNVYGFRPSVGLLPAEPPPADGHGHPLATDGPMARSVRDLARLLDTLADGPLVAGGDDRVGASVPLGERGGGRVGASTTIDGRGDRRAGAYATGDGLGGGRRDGADGSRGRFARALDAVSTGSRPLEGRTLGWLGDLEGYLPTEPGVLAIGEEALRTFESLGARVETPSLDIDPATLWESWTVLRAARVAAKLGVHVDDPVARERLKPEARWEIERGRALGRAEIEAASATRERWLARADALLARHDALVLPSAQVFPFDAATRWPERVGERRMRTYHEWMAVVVPVSLAGLPALAVPAGFGATGLPAGLQLFARHGADAELLRLGEAWHRATDWPGRRPPPEGFV